MPLSCAVFGCSKEKSRRKITFHRFPYEDENLLEKWLIILGRKKRRVSGVEYLCSRHFHTQDFMSGNKLKKNALPSVFDVPRLPRVVCEKVKLITETSVVTQYEPQTCDAVAVDAKVFLSEYSVGTSVNNITCITNDLGKILLISDQVQALLSANKQADAIDLLRKEKEYICAVRNKVRQISVESSGDDGTGAIRWQHKCRSCWRKFHSRTAFMVHLKEHAGAFPYRCMLCSSCFMQKYELADHYRQHAELYKCVRCYKVFDDRDKIVAHMSEHVLHFPYKCDLCDIVFDKENRLADHYEIHAAAHPYTCDVCKESFAHSSYLIVHYRMHPGHRPYECVICKKSFSHSPLLMKHFHVHLNVQAYQCDICSELFTSQDDAFAHCRVHSELYPYECSTCLQTFNSKQHLDFHSRVHEGSGPFECSLCGHTFGSEHHYTLHYTNKHLSCTTEG